MINPQTIETLRGIEKSLGVEFGVRFDGEAQGND
jgi:hypothetical protein